MSLYTGVKLQRMFPQYLPDVHWKLLYNNGEFTLTSWSVPNVAKPTIEEIDSSITDLAIIKEIRSSRITRQRNEALKNLTASWDNDTWDANEETSNRIANALSMVREARELGIPTPPAIPWRTYDNKDRTLTIAELTQMGAAVFLAQQEVWAKQAQLKNAIEAAKTETEVNSVEW